MTPQHILGTPSARVILYLPNPPLLPDTHAIDLTALIQLNGNHWRKILTIFAKLCSADNNWREYRDHNLLKEHEAICFSDQLLHSNNGQIVHLVAGKASWTRLDLNPDAFTALDEASRIRIKDNIILTPYPDYRQFPNALIEQLRPLIAS
ncbi:MAG: hypothetical protein V7731_05970 [Amphritea sp.]